MTDEEEISADRFAELSVVDLREAWAHEANDFTPWLAENLHRLSGVIGVPLEVIGTEVVVGNYQADILARVRDGRRVLIENQLELSDHSHLGQILTYLAGLEARTVIWIARDFNEAHLSAVRWLNENSGDDEDPFDFFAVKLRVVQIDDSRYAPVFDVVERPIDWDRTIRATVRENESPISSFRREFWSHYSKRYPDDKIPENHATSSAWHEVKNADLLISTALGQSSVGIWYRGTWGEPSERYIETVKRYQIQIEQKLGIEIGEQPHYPYYQEHSLDLRSPANWNDAADWLHQKLHEYREAIEAEMSP